MTSFKISAFCCQCVYSFAFICLFVIYLATHFLSIADYIASKEELYVTDEL
jgi:hypothetical protein